MMDIYHLVINLFLLLATIISQNRIYYIQKMK